MQFAIINPISGCYLKSEREYAMNTEDLYIICTVKDCRRFLHVVLGKYIALMLSS